MRHPVGGEPVTALYRTTHPTGYDDVTTLEAGLESRWAAHASTRDLPVRFDEAYDTVLHDYGAVAALEVEADTYTATFTGPRLPAHRPDRSRAPRRSSDAASFAAHADGAGVAATLDRGYTARLKEAFPVIRRYTRTEQDRFLERTVRALTD